MFQFLKLFVKSIWRYMCGKSYFYEMLEVAQSKLACLPADSYLRKYFPKSRFESIKQKIDSNKISDLKFDYRQPFFLFLKRSEINALKDLENDIRLVIEKPKRKKASKVVSFLKDPCTKGNHTWFSNLFEIFVKARLLKNENENLKVLEFDSKLPNKRNADIKIKLFHREIFIECTTLSDTDTSKDEWEKHCEDLKENPDKSLVRSYDGNSSGRRLYDKIFDKIARDFNPNMGQICKNAPNLILIGFNPLLDDLRTDTPSVGWSLHELFGDQPTSNNSPVSLAEWLCYKKKEDNSKHLITDNFNELLNLPRKVSGILLFDGCQLGLAWKNYMANQENKISHKEMAQLEEILESPPSYFGAT